MLYFTIAGAVFGLEYFVKRYMDEAYSLKKQRAVAGGKILLKKYYNTGASGNFLSSKPKLVRYVHTTLLCGVVIRLMMAALRKEAGMAKLGLAFLAGGGGSNLYDRCQKGFVVDYFSFRFGPRRLQKLVFNLADLFVFSGACLFFLAAWKEESAHSLWNRR